MTTSPSSDAQQSRTGATLSIAFERSRTAESIRAARRWSENAWLFAFMSVCIRRLDETLTRWICDSLVYTTVFGFIDRGSTTFVSWVGHSRGHRWLTAEPDPEVIVIDLRETKALGPLLGVLDRLLTIGIPAVSYSRTRRLCAGAMRRSFDTPLRYVGAGLGFVAAVSGIRLVLFGSAGWAAVGGVFGVALVGLLFLTDGRSWTELRETRPVRVLRAVFAPPEPSGNSDSSDSSVETDRERRSENE